jgi:hypothetical protein
MERFNLKKLNEIEGKGCMLLVGKPEGKRSLERPRSRWVDNIKIEPAD